MKYKGIELAEIKEEQILDHTKDYVFWDDEDSEPTVGKGSAVLYTDNSLGAYNFEGDFWDHAAEMPQINMRERTTIEKVTWLKKNAKFEKEEYPVSCRVLEKDEKGNTRLTGSWQMNQSLEILGDYQFGICCENSIKKIIEIPKIEC